LALFTRVFRQLFDIVGIVAVCGLFFADLYFVIANLSPK
jgi:hypothetical protein